MADQAGLRKVINIIFNTITLGPKTKLIIYIESFKIAQKAFVMFFFLILIAKFFTSSNFIVR